MKRITMVFYAIAAVIFGILSFKWFSEGNPTWGMFAAIIGVWDLSRLVAGIHGLPSAEEGPRDPFGDPGPESVIVEIRVIGRDKVAAIKALRDAVPGLGLKDGKDVVDLAMEGRPAPFSRAATPEQAERLREALAASGAGIEVV